ncbi:unnamed protein product [Calypogeia fissa]
MIIVLCWCDVTRANNDQYPVSEVRLGQGQRCPEEMIFFNDNCDHALLENNTTSLKIILNTVKVYAYHNISVSQAQTHLQAHFEYHSIQSRTE